ncbi:NAD(P)/FAD-dependent oxidoreductase [Pantoea piersonii]|uniref:NAD(P)/FAD-dependent oxidoreductase n=1 Tax=Pantoea piersonii TaxID=2364647 RepID=UPI0022F1A7AA|nr:FAD-binding oxidoreductase [Pantoea piersonii]WBV23754.1 FAD-binding oxidoreductase [Pantoea piersonii]
MTQRIAVIGAGVLGLSVARMLALQGAQVTLFDKGAPGAGTSQISFAWVNANGKSPESYHRLNAAGIEAHKRLQQISRAPAPWLLETGTWEWAAEPAIQAELEKRLTKLTALGYPWRTVTREALLAHFPELRLDSRIQQGWFFPSECLLYPSLLIGWLLTQVRRLGGTLISQTEVVTLSEHPDGAALELSNGEQWTGDRVILAAGRWSAELLRQLGLDLAMTDANRPDRVACSFLAYTDPLPIQINSNIISPELNVRPDGGGRLILQALDLDDYADPARPASTDGLIGQEFLRRLRRMFIQTEDARIAKIEVGQRSRPADGLPAVGYATHHQRVYLMASHSGMTLAPLLGELVANEIITGERSEMLADFAPQRLMRPFIGKSEGLAPAYLPAAQ